jgi:hypothetical protein
VAALFENLEDGVSLAEFVELFPGVSLEQSRWSWSTPLGAPLLLHWPDCGSCLTRGHLFPSAVH